LLTGERGHYALCAGEDVTPYLDAMMEMSSPLGLIPEQVWDTAPIPAQDLYPGKPSGSAMPLVWAHAEFAKLCHSLAQGYPVDRPAATWARYRGVRPKIDYDIWGPAYHPRHMTAGHTLYVALTAPAKVHMGTNGWQDIQDIDTEDIGLGACGQTADQEPEAQRQPSVHLLLAGYQRLGRPGLRGRDRGRARARVSRPFSAPWRESPFSAMIHDVTSAR
jgi:hypothetical protein